MNITLTFYNYVGGVLADATAVKASDPTATYGVRRDDTSATVVADGTAWTRTALGTYTLTFASPDDNLTYTYWVESENAGQVRHITKTYTHVVAGSGTPVIESIMSWIAGQINLITTAGGYTYTLTSRRVKGNIDTDSQITQGLVYLVYGDWSSIDITLAKRHLQSQEIICDVTAVYDESVDTNLETKLQVMGSDIISRLVASNTGTACCGGYGFQIEPKGAVFISGEGCHFLELTFVVRYFTDWDDPYTQA